MSVCGYTTYELYGIVPYVTFVVTFLAFVLRCRFSGRGIFLWTVIVAFACSRLVVFHLIGGATLHPLNVLEPLVHVLDVAYFGTFLLAALAVPFFFWRSWIKAVILPAVAYPVALAGVLNAVAKPVVREYVVESDRVPPSLDGYRIVHISDIHAYCGCRRWHTQEIVDAANRLDADLICLTGDFADGHPNDCADWIAPLLSLKAKDGVYAVTGNHEFAADVNPVRDWCSFYAGWGVPFLRNVCVFPRAGLALGGVDDEAVALPKPGAEKYGDAPAVAKAFASATNGEFRVLMQHQPVEAEGNVAEHRIDLQLSGHFHGGFMPIMKERIVEGNGRYIGGLYKIGSGFLCVSAGCGPWGGFPLRYRTPLEIGLITLRHVQEEALE